MRCRGDNSLLLVPHAMDSLQHMRIIVGEELVVNCGWRSWRHNALVGGAPLSEHKNGVAFDISLFNRFGKLDKEKLHQAALQAGFTGFGLNYNTFIHVDKGRRRTW